MNLLSISPPNICCWLPWGLSFFPGLILFFPSQLAHSIRLLLEYTGTPYEDKHYSCGEGEVV